MKELSGIRGYKLYRWFIPVVLLLNMFSDAIETPRHFPARIVNGIWLMIFLSVVNYFFLEYSIPRINSRKKIPSAFLLLLLYIFLYSIAFFIWQYLGILIGIYTILDQTMSIQDRIENLFSLALCSVLVFGIVRHIYNHFMLRQLSQQLRIESQQAELRYLKSQTNPHFLFNTLNNIYALARDKSDLTQESILKLSKILRYMLYDTGTSYTAIEKELRIIEDYIELEKLRYEESLCVSFNSDLENNKQSLPPLLLIPLVENAFKHGVSETRDNPSVNIHLTIKDGHLTFTVENSTGKPVLSTNVKENIGLTNLRRQLALLYTDYNLETWPTDYKYTAILKINLNSYVKN